MIFIHAHTAVRLIAFFSLTATPDFVGVAPNIESSFSGKLRRLYDSDDLFSVMSPANTYFTDTHKRKIPPAIKAIGGYTS